jgi:hypothetical protein
MRVCATIALVASCGGANATDDNLGGYVLGLMLQDFANTRAVNPDDVFDIGGVKGEVALGVEGRWSVT